MMDDTELLRAYAETRSETTFAGFVERRISFVYAAALRMVAGNAHTAQDVTQYYAAMRQAVDVQYGPFYRLQHLTKEQTDALAEALFQRQLRYDTMNDERKAVGSAADAKTANAGADEEFAAVAQETLGEDLYGQLTLYERQREAWDFVGSFGSMLSLADMPLSLEQSAQMADATANANSSFQKDGTIKSTMGGGTDWDAVDAAAAKFLTPAQLDVLKNVLIGSNGGTLGFGASRQMDEFFQAIQNLPSE